MNALKRFIPLLSSLTLSLASALAYAASDTSINLDVSLGIDDNVTRAQVNNDIEYDMFASVGASLAHTVVRSPTGQLSLNLDFSGTAFNEFSGLSHLIGGGGINYTFSPWAGFGAPWFSLDAQYKVLEFDSFLRDSNLFVATGTFGKRIDDRTDMRTGLLYLSRDSDGQAFDTDNAAAFINVDFTIKKKMTLYTTFKYQTGDVFSSADPNNLSVDLATRIFNIAKVIEPDDVFTDKLAYRLDAKTQFYTIGLNIARNLDSAFDLSVRFLTSTADEDGGINYEDLAVRASYFHRFGI